MSEAKIQVSVRGAPQRVVEITPLEDRKVHVVWGSRATEEIDLKPALIGFGRSTVASNDALFRTLRPSPDGRSIVWADGSKLGVFWLEEMALASMTNAEFRDAMRALRLTIEVAAAQLGVSRRSVAGYRTNYGIPRSIALAVRLLLQRRT